ncbi:MAG: glycosyltransferase [Candidatus Hydrogenedentes bacterium]|nr:glycosyltransferase [Candidatus Hydrogenedentota bacterium]
MNVLCHGTPFCSVESTLPLYAGPHDVRTIGKDADARYSYNPRKETWNEVIARIRSEWKPDLVLCWTPELCPPPLGIEDSTIRTVALVSDWNILYPLLAVNLSRYDLVLCDKPGVEVFSSGYVTPQHLFPLYSQVSVMHRPLPIPKDLDVAFAGNLNHAAHPVRGRYLQRLAAMSDRYRIFIGKEILGEDYVRLYNRAHIVFNHSIRGELNLRVFETMACGSMALLEESNLEVRGWFADGRELVLYNDENFEERVSYYIEHPAEAQAVAARGHTRTPEFAAENRLTRLIDWCAAQPSSGRRFHELPPEEQDYQNVLMYGYSFYPVFQEVEERLLARAMQSLPEDPRLWTALGRHFINPYNPARHEPQNQERFLKAFLHAHRLDPSSAPRALNLASLYRMLGNDDQEAHYLQLALEAKSLGGADLVSGNHICSFWQRWQRAVATKNASLETLHAEVRIRLAVILAKHGAVELAEDHLRQAAILDAANTNGIRLWAEIRWSSGLREEAIDLVRHA